MGTGHLLRGLASRARRSPRGTIRQVRQWWRHDPALLIVRIEESLPGTVRRRLHGVGQRYVRRGGRCTSALLALSLTAGQERRLLEAFIDRRASRAPRGERALVAGILIHREQPELALRWLGDRVTAQDLVLRGLAFARQGHLHAARDEMSAAVRLDGQDWAIQQLQRLDDVLLGLDPTWAAPVPDVEPTAPLPRRVVHLVNNSLPHLQTGYTVRTRSVVTAQRDVGLDPIVVTRPGYPWDAGHLDAASEYRIDGVPYRHVRAEGLVGTGTSKRVELAVEALAPVIRSLRPAVLQPTTPHLNAQVAFAMRDAFDIPVVYEMRGFLEETWLSRRDPSAAQTDHYAMTRLVEGACASRADRVVTLGFAMRDDLVARGVPGDRIVVVPNAVDAEHFTPTGAGHQLRQRWLPTCDTLVGYVGSLVAYEGLNILLDAMAALRADGRNDVGCLIVGDGPQRATLEAQAGRLGVNDRVRFAGRVPHDQVRAFHEAIDVFVVPRRDQRVCRLVTPLKPLEAMAMERCVVLSDLPALRELIEPGATGEVFRPEDPRDLARLISELADDRARREQLGQAARIQVLEQRSWSSNADRYWQLYDELGVLS